MLFKYLKTEAYMDSIDIDDIGNCFLQIYNDDGREWLMSVKTKLGWTIVKTFGPFILDSKKSSLFILIGDEVLDSTAQRMASLLL